MKRIYLLFAFTLSISSYTQINGTIDLTSAYSFDIETPGINVRSYLFLNDKICFGPEFTYFFKKNEVIDGEEITVNAFTFDFNAHYLFELVKHKLGFYPVIGIDFTREKQEFRMNNTLREETEEAFGFNIGLGFESPISERFTLLTEYIHTLSEIGDNVVFFGINYEWGKREEKEHH